MFNLLPLFFLYVVRDPSPWNGTTYIGNGCYLYKILWAEVGCSVSMVLSKHGIAAALI